ncbi:hypothetical protein BOSE62_30229 [Bosea sp. 62]|nr:hypothetical protein BOSE46_140004 [Bosea sp. 46]VXB89009.1 hypothetical protein BOSE29B_140005 [Bosea sp. 29B]VXC14732.1 hypothetical protein BOSE62_30229 [Bosea sp. 62]VXC27531.1 hypothetical protein BOSE125_190005 [Bosea sp. 125]
MHYKRSVTIQNQDIRFSNAILSLVNVHILKYMP